MKKYYKTNKPEILKAELDFKNNTQKLKDEWSEWAKQFDGQAVFSVCTSRVQAGYLKLNKHHESYANGWWSRPNDGCSSPVALSNKRVTDKEKQKALIELYQKTQPTIREVSRGEFNEALGTSWGDILFGGLSYFVYGGYIYLSSSANLKNCEEILASEFEQAKLQKETK